MEHQKLKDYLEKIFEKLKADLNSIRTSRATPALVEGLEVEYFGSKTPLKAVAGISSPGPRELLIKPWEKSALPAIEKAIHHSPLGLSPVVDRDTIRLSLPPLTEEKRRELLKIAGRHIEEARIRIRQAREEVNRDIERGEKNGKISEDEKFRQRRETQKIVDETNRRLEEYARTKEKEIINV
jgi:ribosome recycling factor